MDEKELPEAATESIEESDADSEAYTKEREKAAQEHLEESQELAKVNFQFLGEPEPDIDRDPKNRPLDKDSMSDAELEALETQDNIASDDYEPKGFEDFTSETFDSPDINPEAKEFQLKDDKPDEFTGPEAADEAIREGVNPRSVATASDKEGMEQDSDQLTPVSENAEPVSKSSPDANPGRIEKVLDD